MYHNFDASWDINMKEIILSIESKEIRYALLQNRKLSDLIIERKKSRLLSGNIYRGRVTNILHNIQSAFIDIGEGENGFIHISDILENTQKFKERFDMEFEEKSTSKTTAESTDITKILKKDQTVLVQVIKEPIGSKGARLTSNISLPGRFLVLLPTSPHRGVSKKIADRATRDHLKQMIKSFEMPQEMGLICRTASIHATDEELIDEAHELIQAWSKTIESFHKSKRTTLLYQESDIIRKALINALDKKCDRLLIDHYPTYLAVNRQFAKHKKTNPNLVIEYYRDTTPVFKRFNIEREIGRALQRKVWLPSGGYLYFDRTEAMYTIDVNSGRGQQQEPVRNVEESLVAINLEAAEEIARQLRIRNVGGLIVCDFIDMRMRRNQKRVLDRLKECMQPDSAKCTILSMSEFGLIEMTRQRLRESLIQLLFTVCPYCQGNGMIKNLESTSIEIERSILEVIHYYQQFALDIHVHPEVNHYLEKHERKYLEKLAGKLNATISFTAKDLLHLNTFEIYSATNGQLLEI